MTLFPTCLLVVLCHLLPLAHSLPNASECVADSDVTGFPACSYVQNQFNICSSFVPVSDAYNFYHCYCEQKFFDAILEYSSSTSLTCHFADGFNPVAKARSASVWVPPPLMPSSLPKYHSGTRHVTHLSTLVSPHPSCPPSVRRTTKATV
jgi:hypothetical protein